MFSDCPHRWKLNYIDKLRVSEPSIYLLFGTAMHEVLQKYLEIMYFDKVKSADMLNLERSLQEKMIEQFSKKGYELIGCEVPVELDLQNNLKWVGYLDIVIKDTIRDVIKIYDIKTSTMGWNKWQKKDENKTQQLLLYKQFYSKQYNHPIEKIEVEYFIVKRKLYENVDFPQKRVQKFSPASGTVSMNKVAKKLSKFVGEAFNEDGTHTTNVLLPTPSKKACRWCEFNKTEHCSVGVR